MSNSELPPKPKPKKLQKRLFNFKFKPVQHRIMPHRLHVSRHASGTKNEFSPGPKYLPSTKLIMRSGGSVSFARSERFPYLSIRSLRKEKQTEKKVLKKLTKKDGNWSRTIRPFSKRFVTTKAFERHPNANVGKFGKSKRRMFTNYVKTPGPGQYKHMENFVSLKKGRSAVFPKEKRGKMGRKTNVPGPLKYSIKYKVSSKIVTQPCAVFTRGGRDMGLGLIEKFPGPQKYNICMSSNYVRRSVPGIRFGKSKRYPKPRTPGPSPQQYRPSFSVVLRKAPRPTLFLYGK